MISIEWAKIKNFCQTQLRYETKIFRLTGQLQASRFPMLEIVPLPIHNSETGMF